MKSIKKLKSTLFAIAILSAGNLFAQETITPTSTDDKRDEFGFGIKGGLNLANVYDEEGDDFSGESKTGFFAGAFVSAPLSQLFGLQPEINYSQKGFKESGSFLGTDYEFERTANYLDVPLQLQIKPTPYLTFLVGPQFSYLINLEDDYDYGDFSVEDEPEVSEDDYERSVFGVVVGAEANYKGFLFMVRGGFDLTKTESDGDLESPRYKNQVIQFGLGYTFY